MNQEENAKSHSPTEPSQTASAYRPLRIWIPVILLVLMVVARYFMTWFPEVPMVWMVGSFVPFLLSLVVFGWWVTLSRATWPERFLGVVGIGLVLAITVAVMDPSMRGAPILVLTLPTTMASFAIGLIAQSRVLQIRRTWVALLLAAIAASGSAMLKNDGATGSFSFGFSWRWQPTPEEEFLAQRSTNLRATRQPTIESFQQPTWPGFRGPERDGSQHGQVFSADWKSQPPKQIWRIKLGPAWSSFAVADQFLVTQEQRGPNEAIVCYDAENGLEVWAREIKSRFFDELGGLGPRATPTIADGRVFALGAEGWLVCLEATAGEIVWQVDISELTKEEPPMWGYSCSPLVHNGLVIVHAVGAGDLGIVAFDATTGAVRWSVPANKQSYSSMHLTKFFGGEQLVFLGSDGALFLDPATGKTLHQHPHEIAGYRAVQPAVIDSQRLMFTSEFAGARVIELAPSETGLTSKEVWTSRSLKPDFNDFVVHQGYAYGFDGAVFACVDLKDGQRRWKQGRYGKGQVLLLADSNLMLVIAEESGELVLLETNPDEHVERSSLQALDGKTWNHPVVVGNRLYLRNAKEAVCYELP
ncbi:MAG: PQQ-like beta-propeller repeat protein [Planctomycetaceae bacterium]|nr:PQQ-like beta-propeller repeat protein [Planctomycetaceae bacterium]